MSKAIHTVNNKANHLVVDKDHVVIEKKVRIDREAEDREAAVVVEAEDTAVAVVVVVTVRAINNYVSFFIGSSRPTSSALCLSWDIFSNCSSFKSFFSSALRCLPIYNS